MLAERDSSPLVSVLITTYQHAPFISQCLDGILNQQVSFPLEVLVGEDGSTDGTREICQRYAQQHPDRLRLILRDRKDVMVIMGRPTGRANLLSLLNEAKGEYVALCEGDDYWVDATKLARQIALLEADNTLSGCFTGAWQERDGKRWPFFDGSFATAPRVGRVSLADFMAGQGVPTCTMVLRRSAIMPLPPEFLVAPSGDTVLWVHALGKGELAFLPESTAVRTVHPGGLFSMAPLAERYRVRLLNMRIIDGMTRHELHHLIWPRMRQLLLEAWDLAVRERDSALARTCWSSLARNRTEVGWTFTTSIRNGIRAYLPLLDRAITKVWR